MTVDDVKNYFLARLDEIDELNKSKTLSAFSCYAWLIGALSHIAYAGQSEMEDKSDRACFLGFVGAFMKKYDPTLLYENFRCGLIHACSLDRTWKGNDEDPIPSKSTKLFLTHDLSYKQSGKIKVLQLSGVTAIVIYYKDLSDSIRSAIGSMFENTKVRDSVAETVKHQRLVEGVSEPVPAAAQKFKIKNSASSTFTAELSGVYVAPKSQT